MINAAQHHSCHTGREKKLDADAETLSAGDFSLGDDVIKKPSSGSQTGEIRFCPS